LSRIHILSSKEGVVKRCLVGDTFRASCRHKPGVSNAKNPKRKIVRLKGVPICTIEKSCDTIEESNIIKKLGRAGFTVETERDSEMKSASGLLICDNCSKEPKIKDSHTSFGTLPHFLLERIFERPLVCLKDVQINSQTYVTALS